MSVRRRRWRDSSNAQHEGWMIDVQAIGKDGRLRRVRKIAPMQTRPAAEKLEHETRAELMLADDRAVTTAAPEAPLFAAFAEHFVSTYAVTNNKYAEVISKRKILRMHLVPALGDLRLDQVGLAEIEAYKAAKLTAGLAKKTINNHLTVLRKLLSTAVEWRLLSLVPPIKWLKAPAGEFDFLSFEEADRLIAGAEDEWRAMIIVALRTGLRHGELIGLRCIDVDLGAGRLVIRQAVSEGVIGTPKNGRTREVPLDPCPDALAAQARSEKRRPQAHGLAFASPFVRVAPRHAWRAHQERSGAPRAFLDRDDDCAMRT
jgi:integrase